MTASAMVIPTLEELVNKWLQSLEADDHAKGTISRYKSVALSFLSWYEQEVGRPLTLERLSPITQVRYRNFLCKLNMEKSCGVHSYENENLHVLRA
jgi:hypothetical protein